MSKLVFNIRNNSRSGLKGLSHHCQYRTPDGKSKIDPSRSHLNRWLYGVEPGTENQRQSVDKLLAAWMKRTGTKRPDKQAETPYITMVLGASADLMNDPKQLARFNELCIGWLKKEFGDDLVCAELHLDETTPHIHAVVAPTYMKPKRVRRRKAETEAEYQERKTVAANNGERTISWSQSKYRAPDSFEKMRRRLTAAVAELSIEYGDPGQKPKAWKTWMNHMAQLRQREGEENRTAFGRMRRGVKILKETYEALQKMLFQVSGEIEMLADLRRAMRNKIRDLEMPTKTRSELQKVLNTIEAALPESREIRDTVDRDLQMARETVVKEALKPVEDSLDSMKNRNVR